MERLAYLNGQFIPAGDVRIGATDFGFNYAAGVYEVVRIYSGKLFELDAHLTRFQRSADFLGLPIRAHLLGCVCEELAEKNHEDEAILYLQATLGDYGERSHQVPDKVAPTIVMFTQAVELPPVSCYAGGVAIRSVPDDRWGHCDIKSIGLLPNVLAYNNARKSGFYDAVYISPHEQFVLECTASNIFCVKNGSLYTHPECSKILSGITRGVIIRIAQAQQIQVIENPFTLDFMKAADEIFISSTVKEMLPVSYIDETPLSGNAYPTIGRLSEAFSAYVEHTLNLHRLR